MICDGCKLQLDVKMVIKNDECGYYDILKREDK